MLEMLHFVARFLAGYKAAWTHYKVSSIAWFWATEQERSLHI